MNSRERIRICNKQERGGSLNAHQVIRRLLVLCEGRQYVEAQHLINRLSPSALCLIACEMPLDLLAEALPYSSTLLEPLFGRLNTLIHSAKPNVNVDCIIWHLVKLFGSPCESSLVRKCERLVMYIGLWKSEIKCELKEKEDLMECAIQGLGYHGLTHETNESGNFISLQSAIKSSLQLHIDTYKHAMAIIDEDSTADPAQSSHQRLLSLKHEDIQRRLISNKTLLTKLEVPSLRQLHELVGKLRERVEKDKEALVCLNLIKKFDRDVNFKECSAAKIIMDMRKGCKIVQSLMTPQSHSLVNNGDNNFNEDSSSSSFKSDSTSESDGYHSDHSESDEHKILIEEYSLIYKTIRLDTLKLLTDANNFHIADSVKLKILFSIVVLAFRSCHNLRERKLLETRRVLCTQDNAERHKEAVSALEHSIKGYLLATCDVFCLDEVENSIATQIYTSLHGYTCINQLLDTMSGYIEKVARLAWKLSNQVPPYHLDTDFTLSTINQKCHVRTSRSNQKSVTIQQFLWPALLQGNECVSKAIVVT